MPSLSTHVLDTSRGQPAAGVVVELLAADRSLLVAAATNADGRVPREIFGDLQAGVYELVFRAGEYFRARGLAAHDPPFLDEVPVRFGIAEGHYHVPLLLSPYSYSTYRGS
jgi:5-hydroxyisourate hydrolase